MSEWYAGHPNHNNASTKYMYNVCVSLSSIYKMEPDLSGIAYFEMLCLFISSHMMSYSCCQ